jgi:hypothetical protein
VKFSKSRKLLPYGLKFPDGMSANQRKDISLNYRELTMTHYSLFCHLAGAYFQLEELRKYPIKHSRISYFRHFEHFESCYMHVGIIFDQMYHLWGILFYLQGKGKINIRGKLETYLTGRRKKYMWIRFKKLNSNSIELRNNITHFARGANIISNGKCYVPEITKKNINWETQWKFKNWIETSIKANTDLVNCEITLNELHLLLISEFEDYLNNSGIDIRY